MQLSNPSDKIEVIGVGLNQVVGGFEYWNVRKRCQRGGERKRIPDYLLTGLYSTFALILFELAEPSFLSLYLVQKQIPVVQLCLYYAKTLSFRLEFLTEILFCADSL